MVDKRDKSQRVVVASDSRGERSCLFILRRSRHPECPVGPKSCRDLAETASFCLFPGGLDTRSSLQGRFHGATSPSGGMSERKRMLAPRVVLLGHNFIAFGTLAGG